MIAPLGRFLSLILGSSLLLAGRRVFWLLLGAVGFVTGAEAATRLLHRSDLETIIVALGAGILFALLAIFLESVAIGLAGFVGGGYAGWSLCLLLGLQGRQPELTAFLLGGVLGVVLIVVLFDWALVSISSLAGASMIVGSLALRPAVRSSAYLMLLFLGVLIQGLALRRAKTSTRG